MIDYIINTQLYSQKESLSGNQVRKRKLENSVWKMDTTITGQKKALTWKIRKTFKANTTWASDCTNSYSQRQLTNLAQLYMKNVRA